MGTQFRKVNFTFPKFRKGIFFMVRNLAISHHEEPPCEISQGGFSPLFKDNNKLNYKSYYKSNLLVDYKGKIGIYKAKNQAKYLGEPVVEWKDEGSKFRKVKSHFAKFRKVVLHDAKWPNFAP